MLVFEFIMGGIQIPRIPPPVDRSAERERDAIWEAAIPIAAALVSIGEVCHNGIFVHEFNPKKVAAYAALCAKELYKEVYFNG